MGAECLIHTKEPHEVVFLAVAILAVRGCKELKDLNEDFMQTINKQTHPIAWEVWTFCRSLKFFVLVLTKVL